MSPQGIFSILTLIVILAIITTLVTKRNTASIINALGTFFSGSLRVAMGN